MRSPNPLPPPCTTPTATTTTAFKTKIAAAITMLTSVAVRHIAAVDTPALNATTTPTGNDTREIAQGSGGGGGGSGFDFTLLGVVTAAVIVMLVIIIWCCRCRSKRGSSDVRLHINLARMMGGASQRSSAASRRSTGASRRSTGASRRSSGASGRSTDADEDSDDSLDSSGSIIIVKYDPSKARDSSSPGTKLKFTPSTGGDDD